MARYGFSLDINPAALSRSMTRSQWLELHRWLRRVRKRIAEELALHG